MPRRFPLLFALLLLLALSGSGAFTNLSDITGSGAAVQISTTSTRVKWVQVIADPSNSAALRFGDSTTSATKGLKVAAGGGYNTPQDVYSLSQFYIYMANGDKAYVAYGN